MKENKSIIEPKILKGTREFGTSEMVRRNWVMRIMENVFQQYGYKPIENPILNYAQTILGKYGDEGDKLTYQFEDKGKRKLALPYDLTVPLARYFAANWKSLPLPFKRYQIQRVWRAEKPQKGRLREFYQCDVDIIGTKNLIAEAEVARVIISVFNELGIDDIVIKINSRNLINEVITSLNISSSLVMDVIRVIDKLSRIGRGAVKKQLRDLGIEKGAELLQLLNITGSNQDKLKKLQQFNTADLEQLLKYAEVLDISSHLQFDPTLARGLDYYTGIIFEVVSTNNKDLGTICAGGRYDNLCGLFSNENFSGMGVAFGFERIMLILENQLKFDDYSLSSRVLVTIFNENSIYDSLLLYQQLTGANISCEIYFEADRLKKQFKFADRKKIPFVVIQGPDEKINQSVTVKSMLSGKQKNIPVTQLISYIKSYEQH